MIAPRDYIIELKPSPKRWIGFLTLSLYCLFVGIVQTSKGGWLLGSMLMVAGLGGGIVSVASLFSRRMVLRLTPEGFAFGTLRKKYFYRWSDVAVFGVGSVGERKTCFTLKPCYSGEEKLRAINQRSIGFDRFLPDTYGQKPMELARLLEDWRHRYSDTKHTELS